MCVSVCMCVLVRACVYMHVCTHVRIYLAYIGALHVCVTQISILLATVASYKVTSRITLKSYMSSYTSL